VFLNKWKESSTASSSDLLGTLEQCNVQLKARGGASLGGRRWQFVWVWTESQSLGVAYKQNALNKVTD